MGVTAIVLYGNSILNNRQCKQAFQKYTYCLPFADGDTGDGRDEADGMCQKVTSNPNRRCLSTGECRRCKFIEKMSGGTPDNKYEGCIISSDTPICDANASTDKIEFDVNDYKTGTTPDPGPVYPDNTGYLEHSLTPDCVKCRMEGNIQYFSCMFH